MKENEINEMKEIKWNKRNFNQLQTFDTEYIFDKSALYLQMNEENKNENKRIKMEQKFQVPIQPKNTYWNKRKKNKTNEEKWKKWNIRDICRFHFPFCIRLLYNLQ